MRTTGDLMRPMRDQTERSLCTIRLLVSGWSRRDPELEALGFGSAFSYRRADGVEVEIDWHDGPRLNIALRDAAGGSFHCGVECDQGLASVVDELVEQQDRICSSRAGDSVRALTRVGARLVLMAVVGSSRRPHPSVH